MLETWALDAYMFERGPSPDIVENGVPPPPISGTAIFARI
jgi:hypothetical protein